MKKWILFLIPGLFFGFGLVTAAAHFSPTQNATAYDSIELEPAPNYEKEFQISTQLLDTYHYRKIKLNDSLSSVILDEYINSLDNNRTYFLQSDIDRFETHRYLIDDYARRGELEHAYDIYNTFRKRFDEKMDYVRGVLVPYTYDFGLEEYYDTDRSDDPWAMDEQEQNEIWRKLVKSQVLNLKLNGKTSEKIVEILEKRYNRFEKVIHQYRSEDVFQLFMNTVAEAYDPHSNYFSPTTSERFRQSMSLSLEGIGARLQTENDFTKVVHVLPGGPAYKSGLIQEDDRIIGVAQGVDGEMEDVVGWRLDDVVKLIKGPKGTTVRLSILPAETGVNGPAKEIVLVREKIKIEDQAASSKIVPVKKNGKDYKLGIITIPSFYMDFEAYRRGDNDYNSTTKDVKKLVVGLNAEGIDGLLIDLRNNGGGSLAEAIDLTGLFIDNGPVVQIKNSLNKIEVGKTENASMVYGGPLTVLINRFSASASEIFAGAIQDYERGLVIGEQSFGKGTVQSIIDLNRFVPAAGDAEVGQLKLTLQKFYRVTGSSTQHLGVSPDISLPSAFDAEEFGESSRPSALPWDQIKETNFRESGNVPDQLVARLNESYVKRLDSDPHLIELVNETQKLRRSLDETMVSLNEAERKKQMEEADARKPAHVDTAEDTVEVDGLLELGDDIDVNDRYLREGVVILMELVAADIG